MQNFCFSFFLSKSIIQSYWCDCSFYVVNGILKTQKFRETQRLIGDKLSPKNSNDWGSSKGDTIALLWGHRMVLTFVFPQKSLYSFSSCWFRNISGSVIWKGWWEHSLRQGEKACNSLPCESSQNHRATFEEPIRWATMQTKTQQFHKIGWVWLLKYTKHVNKGTRL